MPGLGSLSNSFKKQLTSSRAEVILVPLDAQNEKPVTPGVKFQYFPETYTDTKAANYRQIDIPGGSLPIYQWISSGERVISFTAYFSSDVDPAAVSQTRLSAAGVTSRNPKLVDQMEWLRTYLLPSYSGGVTYAPRKLYLYIPKSGLGRLGGDLDSWYQPDAVLCVMLQCDFSVEASFPAGAPRLITAQLSFAQIGQLGGDVRFPQLTNQLRSNVDQLNPPTLKVNV